MPHILVHAFRHKHTGMCSTRRFDIVGETAPGSHDPRFAHELSEAHQHKPHLTDPICHSALLPLREEEVLQEEFCGGEGHRDAIVCAEQPGTPRNITREQPSEGELGHMEEG